MNILSIIGFFSSTVILNFASFNKQILSECVSCNCSRYIEDTAD